MALNGKESNATTVAAQEKDLGASPELLIKAKKNIANKAIKKRERYHPNIKVSFIVVTNGTMPLPFINDRL